MELWGQNAPTFKFRSVLSNYLPKWLFSIILPVKICEMCLLFNTHSQCCNTLATTAQKPKVSPSIGIWVLNFETEKISFLYVWENYAEQQKKKSTKPVVGHE